MGKNRAYLTVMNAAAEQLRLEMEVTGKKSATSTEIPRTHYTSYTPGYAGNLSKRSQSFRTQDKGIEACFLFYFVQIMTCHLQRWALRLSEATSDFGNYLRTIRVNIRLTLRLYQRQQQTLEITLDYQRQHFTLEITFRLSEATSDFRNYLKTFRGNIRL